jgi:hypothetical protein
MVILFLALALAPKNTLDFPCVSSGLFAGIVLACRCRSNGARILTNLMVGRTGQNTVTTSILGLSHQLKGPMRIHGCDCLHLPS